MKNKIIILAIIAIVLLITGCTNKEESVKNIELQQFTSNNKTYTIKKGEELSVNGWNELEIYYSGDKKVKEQPTIYEGIKLGSNYKDVLKKFNIKPEYAYVDMEVPTKEHDGTTDIITEVYKDDKVFDKDYLDLSLTFGYIKKNNKWEMIKYEELKKYKDDGKTELLIYYIDFNGMSDEIVKEDELISYIIRLQ